MSQPFLYIKSFSGMIDLITMFTSLIAICFPSSGRDLFSLLILRIFRILRVFRIFRLAFFFQVTSTLGEHLETNKHGITALFSSIFCTIFFIGSAMYLIEGERSGFSNIPITLYWTFMTFTTVGLNDPSPSTVPGKIMAIVVVLAGYGIIALAAPVFLTTMPSSMISSQRGRMESPCSKCFEISHERDARFCRYCGTCLHRNRNLMTGRRLRLTTTTKTRGRTMSGEDLTTVMSPTEAQKTEFVANHYYEDQNMTKCSISEESLRAATNASDHFV
jgi:voltage-gated potassium channel